MFPPRLGGGAGDVAAAGGAQCAGAGWPAFEASEPAEGGGVRIRFGRDGAAAENRGALGRGMAASAFGADFKGGMPLFALVLEFAHQTAPADAEQEDLPYA